MRYVVILALVACGDNVVGSLEPRSGTRLKVQLFELDGVREQAPGVVDDERAEVCWPMAFSNGVTYCAPVDPLAIPRVVYTDQLCGSSLVEGAGTYAIAELWLVDRFVPSRIHRVGASTPAPAQVFTMIDGACQAGRTAAATQYFEVGEEVPRESFAELGTTSVALDERMSLQLVTSTDGLRAPATFVDRSIGACELDAAPGVPLAYECRPRGTAEVVQFHDAACTEPVLEIDRNVTPPELAFARDESGCATHYRVREQTTGALFERVGGACVATIGFPDRAQYLLRAGDAVALPRVLGSLGDESGRYRSAAIAQARFNELFDSTLGVACRIDPQDGRCQPRTIAARLGYDAETCETPRFVVATRRPCDPRVAFVRLEEASPIVYALGPSVQPGTVYVRDGSLCKAFDATNEVQVHELGGALSTLALPAATRLVDR